MKRLLFLLFVIGTLGTIVGWFFDRALDIETVTRVIAPDYHHGEAALRALEANPRVALTREHPGFAPILTRWPNLPEPGRVATIGRSVAFMKFGPTVRNEIELIARDSERGELTPRWNLSGARVQLRDEAESTAFLWGTVIFFGGLCVSTISGVIEFWIDR
ncbi:MAG: hypothetical protein EWM73_02946 [Nitrospira sp.]|nr:MAG: hypothetical protein EWM73_02946 [Nitrospira sp.]